VEFVIAVQETTVRQELKVALSASIIALSALVDRMISALIVVRAMVSQVHHVRNALRTRPGTFPRIFARRKK